MPKRPNPTDEFVGGRVRMRRKMLGLSQEKLGEQLGVTFQQVQKYEKGTNRIGASRLQALARTLDVPISFFFPEATGESVPVGGMAEGQSPGFIMDFVASSEGLELTRAFARIKDGKVRRKIIDLVRSIADNDSSE
ncbi:helix-turn-helix domain-containing protein [Faunimonas pinastri]|uniref:helix-turn-helix domain-containing protein n=1 Tax=Faunimonas pinastri TaxID=1855383 RepID=UPI003D17A934